MPIEAPAARASIFEPLPASAIATTGKQTGKEVETDEFTFTFDDQSGDRLERAFRMPTGPARQRYVVSTLVDTMRRTQGGVWNGLQALQGAGHVVDFQPLFISNAVRVRVPKGDEHARSLLAGHSGATDSAAGAGLVVPTPAEVEVFGGTSATSRALAKDPDWGVTRMGFRDAWKDRVDGRGIDVGGVDTGVDVDHPALAGHFRGRDPRTGKLDLVGNWVDGTGESPDKVIDPNGHGTHVHGIVGGDDGGPNQTGGAPGSRWMHGRGLREKGGGTVGMLLTAQQGMLAPTTRDKAAPGGARRAPERAPLVVNNSWGDTNAYTQAFLPAVRAMAAAGIVNVFSAGNDGQYRGNRGSLGSPGNLPWVLSVGASKPGDATAGFSSVGPNPVAGPGDPPKPFVTAPGDPIRSSIPGGLYDYKSGTSMSGPEVTAAVALIQQVAMETTGHAFDLFAATETVKRLAEADSGPGVKPGKGYGIPSVGGLRDVVAGVVRDLELPVDDKKATAFRKAVTKHRGDS